MIFVGGPAPLDKLFLPIERLIYKLIGVADPEAHMSWPQYALALVASNAVMGLLVFLLFRVQAWLPWNPQGAGAMDWSLAFNTAIPFITNTNLQHYAGETALSYLTQMGAITFLMFTSAASGFATAVAFSGALTTFSIANDVAKYFAIIPALLVTAFPALGALNVMGLASPQSAILSALIFNALIIPALIPLAMKGVAYLADERRPFVSAWSS